MFFSFGSGGLVTLNATGVRIGALLLALGWLVAGSAPNAGAKVYIDINAPALRPVPVAVPLLRKEAGVSGEPHRVIAEVLRWDLGFAGLFEVVDPRAYLEDPQRAPLQPDAAGFADWMAIGAELLIKGRAQPGDLGLSVDLWAYDVLRRSFILGRHYDGPAESARSMAHRFANTLLEEFTGTPGPFGSRIAYVVGVGRGKELALVDMDGANPVRLTRTGSLNLTPSWSRDGGFLYYTSYVLGEPDLYLLDLSDGRSWVVSRRGGIDLGGRDSPDGTEILLTLSENGNSEIYRMEKATRRLVRLTRSRAIDVAPAWSPDGRQVVFVSDRMGNPHIFVMNRDGGDVRRLTYAGTHNGDPEWSPRGDWIAFTGKDDRGRFQVYLVDPRGREVRQLTFGAWDTYDPTWSPDGRFLAVTSNRGGEKAVYVFRVGGQEFRRVTPRGEVAEQPAWGPAVR
ncbi:MAG: Tol-Pal system beta propeller repeat protein TolB [Candidatus Dadabacteria bacterium]|nr:MAG: Tol-Pal system beta propeller repeat protein TolB [Candidatus Dadabacteria bacterium]